jgi:RNA polymerase sigma factor (sigma-70 family)
VSALTSRSDALLLHDQADPAESFAVFYRRHSIAMIRYAASRGLDAESAADVVSETFMAALRQRRRYRPQYDNARLWLLGIATRKIADVHRRRALDLRRHRLLHESIGLTKTDRASYEELLGGQEEPALAALADLPVEQRATIRAHIVEDRAYRDIAREMGLTEPAVRKRVSRGLGELRDQLGGAND